MATVTTVSSTDEKVHIRKSSRYDSYDILTGEEQAFRMSVSEEELRDLRDMIDEILQTSNKRDW